MLARLCQLKSLLLITLIALSSCSFFRNEKEKAVELLTPMKNEWFSKNSQHALWDQQGKPQPHQFFDILPELSKNDDFVNAVVLTPEASAHSYQFDITSGQRFYSHTYCSQSDVWNQYSGAINKPTFTIGILPRLVDQLGEPQKVIIFGGAKSFARLVDNHEHRIRLLGAFVEQICPEGNCLGKNNWVSRMVFVAIDPEDKNYVAIADLAALEKKVSWDKTKAVYENIDGRNGGGGVSYPAIRLGKLFGIREAMDYYRKHSIYISEAESEKIRIGCQSLYDKLWTDVGVERPEDKPSKTIEELNIKVKLTNELKKQRKPVGFSARLHVFAKKYYNEYATCQKFIYSGNMNLDQEKFWFLSYMGIFFRLHKEGYYYDCNRKTWNQNVIDSAGKAIYDFQSGIMTCKDKDIDRAMDYLPNFLTGLKSTNGNYYKFVDYDTTSVGTHQKLYSWVKVKSRKYDCHSDPNPEIKKEIKVFPEDVNWKTREVKDIADELKIIY